MPSLEPYDQGYRDGWADAHAGRRYPWSKRRRRAERSGEYALGYRHGRDDGADHPEMTRWWPDYARSFPRTNSAPKRPRRPETPRSGHQSQEAA